MHSIIWEMVTIGTIKLDDHELVVQDPVALFGRPGRDIGHPSMSPPPHEWRWDPGIWYVSWLFKTWENCIHVKVACKHTTVIHWESFRRWRMMELL